MTATPSLPGAGPGGVVEVFVSHREYATAGDSCVVAIRDPWAEVSESFHPALDHFATDNNITPIMIAGFRRDVERAARGTGGLAVANRDLPAGFLGESPLVNPAEQLTPDDWAAVTAVPAASSPLPDAAQSSPARSTIAMPLAEPSAYAARAAGLDRTIPVARRAIRASKGEFKASGLGGLFLGTLLNFLIANLPKIIEIIVDAWEATKTAVPSPSAGDPISGFAPVPLNAAVRKAIQDERAGLPEAD
jgi:hypothetical protein